jgi:protocatechuate 3,4-dioxygenase beta subunit
VTGATGDGVACVLSPEMTEGPYYIDGEAVRRDVTEGKPGVPLRLELNVADASTCSPIPGAAVEIWHADAGGNYSGFNATADNTTFLRGVQIADADGDVTFDTVYPGWYEGRATHIHLMVHVDGDIVHTGQLFFDELVNDAVYTRSPYADRSGTRMTNDQDGIYANGGAQSMLQLTEAGDGYRGAITLGVQAS